MLKEKVATATSVADHKLSIESEIEKEDNRVIELLNLLILYTFCERGCL